jgi:hypothetical protein
MLTLQPYRPGRYPPAGPQWVQFGDDIVNGAVDDVRAVLERKKQWKREHHLTRLQDDRMMPLGHHFASHQDPEEDAVDGFDHPPPSAPPPPDHRPGRERARRSEEEAEGGYHTAGEEVDVGQPSSSILGSLSSGANSTIASMGAGLVHGTAYIAGAAAGAVGRGLARGITHLATGHNPMEVADDEPEIEEPLHAYPKARAKARARHEEHYIGTDDEGVSRTPWPPAHAPPAPKAAAAPKAAPKAAGRSGPSRPIAQRDVLLAQQTLASLPPNDEWGRGGRTRQREAAARRGG